MANEWKPDEALNSMMTEAETKRLWFYSSYQALWFSPGELRAAWDRGQFRWGAASWQLIDPKEQVTWLTGKVEQAKADLEKFLERLAGRTDGK